MAENSTIEWTDHTFNIVWGCVRVSPGCQHCYAETLAKRYGHDVWGPAKTTARRVMSANYWKQPFKWNADAEARGERKRVFCGSMSDVFEDHPTNNQERTRLWSIIDQTPHLNWLLLTKRPENIRRFWEGDYRANVWRMTSVEDQQRADKRIPELIATNDLSPVAGLSCEPLLGAVDISRYLSCCPSCGSPRADRAGDSCPYCSTYPEERNTGIHWVIGGGESGPEARHCETSWARSLRDQCVAAGVNFFWKQWGEYVPSSQAPAGTPAPAIGPRGRRAKAALAQIFGEPSPDDVYWRVGKHAAGRLLDQREWNETPESAAAAVDLP